MSRVVHFEIHAGEPEVACSFYSSVFGWKITKWDGPWEYWLVSTGEGPGIDGGIVPRRGGPPLVDAAINAYVCTINVASIDETQAAILRYGGMIAIDRREIPEVGVQAYFKDPDGNIFGVLQPA
jgi:uncharacterized protein